MRHALDPKSLHDEAFALGKSVAEGGCTLKEAHLVCATMAEMHTGSPVNGIRARLCWTATDTATAHAKELWRAEDGLRLAVRPMIRERAAKAQVEEVAGEYADILGWPRIFGILRDEVYRSKSLGRRK